ncbi:amidohydrolase [Virgibacillus salexigens]|uniref:amidohydrolase n=1 Tax=Virgibacillus salexigens TaxID=61016 RepID=UPI001909DB2F|nr:amidohydrolase [Virgibacillus salexigens]
MKGFIESITPQLIQWRRDFHQYPELGFTEYVTSYKLAKELERLGFTIHIGKDVMKQEARLGIPSSKELQFYESKAIKHGVEKDILDRMQGGMTGVIATWNTGRPGDHVALRFDIDALPIQETRETSHFPHQQGFISLNEQVMHACGHDGHMTIGLGVASFISDYHERLCGKFTLLFQPAEEGGRGAKAITANGWLDDVDYFYSGHIGIESLPVGTVAATVDGFLASSKLNVTFKGVSSHAGMKPELGKNALLAASSAVSSLYGISRHSGGITRINVGKMMAGSGRNIIPADAYLEIETRGETEEMNSYMQNEAKRIIKASAMMQGVEYQIEAVGQTEQLKGSNELISSIEIACDKGKYIEQVWPVALVSGSEDASFMMNRVQANNGLATYMLFGTPLDFPHHHPSFDFQEDVLPVAVEALTNIIQTNHSNK